MKVVFANSGQYEESFQAGLRPDPIQTIGQWADEHVQLPSYSSEAGQWRTSRTPYLAEILECLSPSHPCNEIVLMKSHQIGGTQAAVNWMGFVIDRAPSAMMVVEPTVDLAKKLSKQKVQPMLDLTPCLKGKVKEARTRDSGNTILAKDFLGGMLVFTGSNSGVGLRFMSAKYLVLDELDAYVQDVDGEGHPAELAENRTSTFARRKIFKLSTPLETETSMIEPAYNAGSRGRYHVPCPFCLGMQWLKFAQLIFTFDGIHKPHAAAYRCEHCQVLIPEHHKSFMLEHGQWHHEDPGNSIRSFHINSLYMPYGWPLSWGEIARRYLKATQKAKGGDRRALKAFINTILAETWQEKGEKVERHELWQRREAYPAECPEGICVLTAAIDVQDDRLEAEIVGWGEGEESWGVGYQRFYGSPAHCHVWTEVTAWLSRPRTHESGVALRVEIVVIDTGGHHTHEAYEFVKTYRSGRIHAIKGSNQPGAPLIPPRPGKSKTGKLFLWHVGTTAAKDTIFPRLKLTEFGPGYMHHPASSEYDEEYFEQLSSEEKRLKYTAGVLVGYFYKKTRARNEALDLKVYNLAALALLNPNLKRVGERLRQSAERLKAEPLPSTVPEPEASSSMFTRPQRSAPQKASGFVKRWRT